MRHHPVLHRRVCFFLHRYQVLFQPPTRSLKGKGSSSPPPPLHFACHALLCRRQHCYWRRWQKLIPRLAFTSIELSLSLDCRRYCSLVETWRHISQGWNLHRIKAGRQQTNCLWQRMLYCLLDLMDRQFLPRYLWMMRLGIPHCDTTCTFSCFKVHANLP